MRTFPRRAFNPWYSVVSLFATSVLPIASIAVAISISTENQVYAQCPSHIKNALLTGDVDCEVIALPFKKPCCGHQGAHKKVSKCLLPSEALCLDREETFQGSIPKIYDQNLNIYIQTLHDSESRFPFVLRARDLSPFHKPRECAKIEAENKIKIGAPIGRGTTAIVRDVTLNSLPEIYAIKTQYLNEGAFEAVNLRRVNAAGFINELNIAVLLGKKLTPEVKKYYVCLENGLLAGKIIMTKMTGTLREYKEHHLLTTDLKKQLGELVSAAHHKNIFLRDLNHGNFLYQYVNGKPRFYLADFETAEHLSGPEEINADKFAADWKEFGFWLEWKAA